MHKVKRRWGSYEVLATKEGCLIKELIIEPGKSISLQYHNYRDEHWVIRSGVGAVRVGENIIRAEAGSTFSIKAGQIHKILNIGLEELVLIEVQLGKTLSEDDIIRLEEIDETRL